MRGRLVACADVAGAKAFKAAFDEQVNEIESQAIGDNSARAALRAGVEQLVTPVLEAFGACGA